jgi:hypothetical protein
MAILPSSVEGAIVGPNGELLARPTRLLTDDEARVIRAYKKIKLKYGFSEENHCHACGSSRDRSDGMRGFTTDQQIMFECRCRMLFYEGQSY